MNQDSFINDVLKLCEKHNLAIKEFTKSMTSIDGCKFPNEAFVRTTTSNEYIIVLKEFV